MDEYELLRYVKYIINEKVKIQHFLGGLPQTYKDRIEFNAPKDIDDAIRKDKYCYEWYKNKQTISKAWKEETKD
jgi:hypothetical protein